MFSLIKNRSLRTVFLAVAATVTFVCSAIFIFDVDAQLMLKLFLITSLGVLALIGIALCVTVLHILLKRWLFK